MEPFIEFINLLVDLFWKDEVPGHVKWILITIVVGIFLFINYRNGNIRKLFASLNYFLLFNPDERLPIIERRNYARNLAEGFERSLDPKTYVELDVQSRGSKKKRPFLKTIQQTRKRLIIVEGGPGSGKTASLHQYARRLAFKASKSLDPKSPIPVYVNLRDLKSVGVDARTDQLDKAIRGLIINSLNPHYRKEITEFIEREFEPGLRTGAWLFIFDSFDEIPDILRSTQKDKVVQQYIEAIDRFLGGINACRGIITSRHYFGPNFPAWPLFLIQPLNTKQTKKFISKSGISQAEREEILIGIDIAGTEFKQMARTPLFLSLLCKNITSAHEFPESINSVYLSYLNNRLNRFDQSMQRQYNLTKGQLQEAIESIAFTMIESNLGLNPPQSEIIRSLTERGVYTQSRIEKLIKVLIQIGLLVPSNEDETSLSDTTKISFFHRRIQEFLAAQYILSYSNLQNSTLIVSAHDLLTDGRWRDITVALLQVQAPEKLEFIFSEALIILRNEFWNVFTNPTNEYEIKYCETDTDVRCGITHTLDEDSCWITRLNDAYSVQYILGILRDGLARRNQIIPEPIKLVCQAMIQAAYWQNSLQEKMASLPFISLLDEKEKMEIFENVGLYTSREMINFSIEHSRELAELPRNVKSQIVKKVTDSVFSGRIWHDHYSIGALLFKIPLTNWEKKNLMALKWIPILDFALALLGMIFFVVVFRHIVNTECSPVYLGSIIICTISLVIMGRSFGLWQKSEKIYGSIRSLFYDFRLLLALFPILASLLIIVVMIPIVIYSGYSLASLGNSFISFLAVTGFLPWLYIIVPSIISLAENHGTTLHPTLWIISPIFLLIMKVKEGIKKVTGNFTKLRNFIISFKNRCQTIALKGQQMYTEIISQPWKTVKSLLIWLPMILTMIILYYFYFFSIPFRNIANNAIPYIYMFSISTILIAGAILYLFSRRHDHNKHFIEQQEKICINQLLDWMLPVDSVENRIWPGDINSLIVKVLEMGNLEPTPDAIYALKKLAILIQCSENLHAKSITFTLKSSQSLNFFEEWLIKFQRANTKGISSLTMNTMDKLNDWLIDNSWLAEI